MENQSFILTQIRRIINEGKLGQELGESHIPVDVFDESANCWESGIINRIEQPIVDFPRYDLRVEFPHWNEINTFIIDEWAVYDNQEDFAPQNTRIFSDWSHSFGSNCRVLYYWPESRSTNTTVKSRWMQGKIVEQTDTHVYIQAWRRTHELSFKVDRGSLRVQKFCQYIQDAKTQKQREKKKKQKQKKERILQCMTEQPNIPIINKDTVEYRKNQRHLVKKTCYAWRKGWVNEYGVPKLWENENNILCPELFRYVSDFLDHRTIFGSLSNVSKNTKYLLYNVPFIKNMHIQTTERLLRATHEYQKKEKQIYQIKKSDEWKKIKRTIREFGSKMLSLTTVEDDETSKWDTMKKTICELMCRKEEIINLKSDFSKIKETKHRMKTMKDGLNYILMGVV